MWLKLIGLIVPLGLDTFAVSAALGMAGITQKQRLKLSLFFTAFETIMPIVGLLIGDFLHALIGDASEYIAYLTLIIFGLYTIIHNKLKEEEMAESLLAKKGLGLLIIGISITIDEIAIGFTLGLLHFPFIPILIWIGVQTFIFAQLGMRLGAKLSERFREASEYLAGAVLSLLGLALLLEKVFS